MQNLSSRINSVFLHINNGLQPVSLSRRIERLDSPHFYYSSGLFGNQRFQKIADVNFNCRYWSKQIFFVNVSYNPHWYYNRAKQDEACKDTGPVSSVATCSFGMVAVSGSIPGNPDWWWAPKGSLAFHRCIPIKKNPPIIAVIGLCKTCCDWYR